MEARFTITGEGGYLNGDVCEDGYRVPLGPGPQVQDNERVVGHKAEADVSQVPKGCAQGSQVGAIGVVQLVHFPVQGPVLHGIVQSLGFKVGAIGVVQLVYSLVQGPVLHGATNHRLGFRV